MKEIKISISGMSCAACSLRVEKALAKTDGIESPSVNLPMERALVKFDPLVIDENTILETIRKTGYGAELIKDKRDEYPVNDEPRVLRNRVIISALLSAPLMGGMFAMLTGIHVPYLHEPLVQLILTSPVQFIIGWRFYRMGWLGLIAKSPGMDLLVALGTTSAFALSVYNGFILPMNGRPAGDLYFEASAVIITLVLLGKYFEAAAKGRTTEAVRKLLDIRPVTAEVIIDGKITTIPVENIKPGDTVHVKAGTRLPADGIIVSGDTTIDESMMTGEPLPADKKPGDRVSAGTVNLYGTFTFRADRVGEETFLSKIIRSIEDAQMTKPPIQRLADRISGIFVPSIILISVITAAAWMIATGDAERSLLAAISVLVIACPCALGLATPTAVMVGTGIGASLGILIRNGESLEKAGRINTVILDKTGTITEGKPAVESVEAFEGFTGDEVISLAASASKGSEHPISKSILLYAESVGYTKFQAEDFAVLPGLGVRALINGSPVFLGSARLMRENNIPLSADGATGRTDVFLSSGNKPAGKITLTDKIKPGSAAAVAKLKAMGIETIMATGDSAESANAIAAAAGIEKVFSGIMPDEKKSLVMKLQAEGKITAMAGDGINDAPALAQSDCGIALASGSDIAVEAADITLIGGDINSIPRAVNLSKKTVNKIKQNLFWAFAYNAAGIPLAALGMLNPMIAAAAMAMSSVSVVTNSLMLKRARSTLSR